MPQLELRSKRYSVNDMFLKHFKAFRHLEIDHISDQISTVATPVVVQRFGARAHPSPAEAHFGIIFLSVFVTFVFMAMGFFGRTVEGERLAGCYDWMGIQWHVNALEVRSDITIFGVEHPKMVT